jgi:hypothetical protein
MESGPRREIRRINAVECDYCDVLQDIFPTGKIEQVCNGSQVL